VARQQFEREFINQRLKEYQWDSDKVASSLGLERTALHRKLVQYNLSPEPEKVV
jgi:two-component system nitrogen regulation response regulator NtrX